MDDEDPPHEDPPSPLPKHNWGLYTHQLTILLQQAARPNKPEQIAPSGPIGGVDGIRRGGWQTSVLVNSPLIGGG